VYKKSIIESLINAFELYNTPINDTGGDRVLTANLLIDFDDREKLLNYFNFEEMGRIYNPNKEDKAEVKKVMARKKLKKSHDKFIDELNELEKGAYNMECKKQYNLIQKVKNFGLTQFETLLPNLKKDLQQRAAGVMTHHTRLIDIYANMDGIINKNDSINTNINLIEQSINSSIKDLEYEYFNENNTLAMTGGRNYIGKTTKYIKIKRTPTKRRPTKRRPTKRRPTKRRPTKRRPTKRRPIKRRPIKRKANKKEDQ